ncbi:MAG: hypothetical protein JNL77_14490 [Nitrosomonas sp.]|nr:hypothetical protein [Nitrosomonas sp.]
MIIIKQIKDGQTEDYRAFPTSVRGLSHAVYWLREIRLICDPYLLMTQKPVSWLEIDGIKIPDAVMFQLNKEQYCSHFLKLFLRDHPPASVDVPYKK